jgi:membrane protease YdiL (CAAX protease family)
MGALRSLLSRYPLAVFLILACAFSWWTLLLGGAFLFGPGPSIAAVVVTAISGGRGAVRELLLRLIRWRVAIIWYVIALGLPIVITPLSVYLNVQFGAPVPTPEQLGKWPSLLLLFPIVFLFFGAAEELGWRGYALHTLQQKRSALTATFIVFAMAIVWHLPLFIAGSIPVSDIAFMLAGYIVYTWLYNSSGYSVLIVMLSHAMQNTISGEFFSNMFEGTDAERLGLLRAALYGVVALAVILVTGPRRLSSRTEVPHPVEPQPVTKV